MTFKEYLTAERDGLCIVCGQELHLFMDSDLHGQAVCYICGTTYSFKDRHGSDDHFRELGVEPGAVKYPYCDMFDLAPLCLDYWNETRQKMAFSCKLMPREGEWEQIKQKKIAFWLWVEEHRVRYEGMDTGILWDNLAEQAQKWRGEFQGAGI
jgi:hypothetical protein